jgi:hypothetical protein
MDSVGAPCRLSAILVRRTSAKSVRVLWPGHVRGLPSGGCGDSSAEREFPSHKVYRRDDRGIVGVESFSAEGLAFVVTHTVLDAPAARAVPACSTDHGWQSIARSCQVFDLPRAGWGCGWGLGDPVRGHGDRIAAGG